MLWRKLIRLARFCFESREKQIVPYHKNYTLKHVFKWILALGFRVRSSPNFQNCFI